MLFECCKVALFALLLELPPLSPRKKFYIFSKSHRKDCDLHNFKILHLTQLWVKKGAFLVESEVQIFLNLDQTVLIFKVLNLPFSCARLKKIVHIRLAIWDYLDPLALSLLVCTSFKILHLTRLWVRSPESFR